MAAPVRRPDALHGVNPPQRLEVVRDVELVVPAADRAWLKATRVSWVEYWGSDVARLVDAGADVPALRRLFDMYDESERAKRLMRRQRFVDGSKGQPVLSPAAKQWTDLMKSMVPLEDRFGITPRGRLNLGIKLGDAAASLERLNALAADPVGEELGEDPRDVLDV